MKAGRRGRPLTTPSGPLVPAATGLPAEQFDALCQAAADRNTSLSEILREVIGLGISQMKNRHPEESLLP